MSTKPSDDRRQRIADECVRLQVRPWQYAPSEICDGPCPFGPGDAEWDRVTAQRAAIRTDSPGYFDGDKGLALYKFRNGGDA